MKQEDLVVMRRKAERAVADMQDGPLKIAAFQTVLSHLLGHKEPEQPQEAGSRLGRKTHSSAQSGTTARVMGLVNDGFFAQQRSLAEIQSALAERGWHYPQEHLGTPLTRLVRRRALRRAQVSDGSKTVWKYSIH